MSVGIIADAPFDHYAYARVRSEYGEEYTVHSSELAPGAADEDEMAYRVDIWPTDFGSVTTLRDDIYAPK